MDSKELAQYIEATDGISKPWLLVQLRLKKLQERKEQIPPQEYMQQLEDIQADLLKLGEWWKGREDEVFGVCGLSVVQFVSQRDLGCLGFVLLSIK